MQKIFYTKTDEAPALATRSLLPILKSVFSHYDLLIELKDISLAGRILAQFGERIDDLMELKELVKQKDTFLIKLPNISASIPQLEAAVEELKRQGCDVHDVDDITPKKESTRQHGQFLSTEGVIKHVASVTYKDVLGSAVNPVIRQGNSKRYIPKIIKDFAKKRPHSMGEWSKDSKTHVSHMSDGDFFQNEKSFVAEEDAKLKLVFGDNFFTNIEVTKGDVIDLTYMNMQKLRYFFLKEIQNIESDVLLSIHLKATMMKISDPIIFKEFVKTYLNKVAPGKNLHCTNGLSELSNNLELLKKHPMIAMVGAGISNIHTPNSTIIDSSMAMLIKDGGKMPDVNGTIKDVKCIIPDRSYCELYKQTIEFCKKNGAFDPAKMGSVSNIGLMAMKAEEYGSHDKTFQAHVPGIVKIVDQNKKVLMETIVQRDDIVRACVTKDAAILDWIKLIEESQQNKETIVWLDEKRSHDKYLIQKIKEKEVEVEIMNVKDATKRTLETIKAGKDIVCATGNVLRDYITDLFPILEVGTSSKMLSTVPLLSGGKIYETGAGGSAPKHVKQFLSENHLRWNSLGEFLAISELASDLAEKNPSIKELATAIEKANAKLIENNKLPKRNVHEMDVRGSHFYWTLYLLENLKNLSNAYKELSDNEQKIVDEFKQVQGKKVNIGGYYNPDDSKADAAMRPSETFNQIISSIRK